MRSVSSTSVCLLLGTSGVGAVLPVAAQQPLSGAVQVQWQPEPGHALGDRGIGIVHLAAAPGAGTPRGDTILLRGRPDPAAAAVGAFIYAETDPGRAWRYSVAAPVRLEPNVLEFAYEEAGVPLDSLTVDASWARAVLGFEAGGRPYRGWVRLDTVRVRYRLWVRELPKRRLFFLDGRGGRVLERPGGSALAVLRSTEDDGAYILHPLGARGPWLQVRVARPADICGESESGPVDTLMGWIRYLDARGRPLVWYHTRGC